MRIILLDDMLQQTAVIWLLRLVKHIAMSDVEVEASFFFNYALCVIDMQKI
jgi:hypothetical protein